MILTGCSSPAPTPTPVPASPPTPTAPPPINVVGHVTATNGNQPLSDVNAAMGSATANTDASGTFTIPLAPTTVTQLRLTGTTIVPRSLTVGATATRDLSVSAIALSGGFDMSFYRQLVRDGLEEPTTLQPLRRWTRTPQIYLRTTDDAGEPIDRSTLDVVETVLVDGVPRWTSGALGPPAVTRGTDSREGVTGWITVKFPAVAATDRCGRSLVGADGGWIELEYHAAAGINCRVPGFVIAPRSVRHELGHALGLWHTDGATDVMRGGSWTDGTQLPSARELYHIAIAYQRPIGNTDPDSDPASSVNVRPARVVYEGGGPGVDASSAFGELTRTLPLMIRLMLANSLSKLGLSKEKDDTFGSVYTATWTRRDETGSVTVIISLPNILDPKTDVWVLRFEPATEVPMPAPILSHLLAHAKTNVGGGDELELEPPLEHEGACYTYRSLRVRMTTGALLSQFVRITCPASDAR